MLIPFYTAILHIIPYVTISVIKTDLAETNKSLEFTQQELNDLKETTADHRLVLNKLTTRLREAEKAVIMYYFFSISVGVNHSRITAMTPNRDQMLFFLYHFYLKKNCIYVLFWSEYFEFFNFEKKKKREEQPIAMDL